MRCGVSGMEAADGTMLHEGYCSVNPFGLVPALRVDDGVILETPALLQMIARLPPQDKKMTGGNMIGCTAAEKSECSRMVHMVIWNVARYGVCSGRLGDPINLLVLMN